MAQYTQSAVEGQRWGSSTPRRYARKSIKCGFQSADDSILNVDGPNVLRGSSRWGIDVQLALDRPSCSEIRDNPAEMEFECSDGKADLIARWVARQDLPGIPGPPEMVLLEILRDCEQPPSARVDDLWFTPIDSTTMTLLEPVERLRNLLADHPEHSGSELAFAEREELTFLNRDMLLEKRPEPVQHLAESVRLFLGNRRGEAFDLPVLLDQKRCCWTRLWRASRRPREESLFFRTEMSLKLLAEEAQRMVALFTRIVRPPFARQRA